VPTRNAWIKSATINSLFNDYTTRGVSCLDHINRSGCIPSFTFFLFIWVAQSRWIESLPTFSRESILGGTLKEIFIFENKINRKKNWLTRFDRWLARFEAMRLSTEQRGQKSVSRLDEKQLHTAPRLEKKPKRKEREREKQQYPGYHLSPVGMQTITSIDAPRTDPHFTFFRFSNQKFFPHVYLIFSSVQIYLFVWDKTKYITHNWNGPVPAKLATNAIDGSWVNSIIDISWIGFGCNSLN